MPKKSFLKKKAFKLNCRAHVLKGRVNDAAGNWIVANETGGEFKNMHRDMRAGYKVR